MRKLVREVAKMVRDLGGKNVRITERGRHTEIHFINRGGKRASVLVHRGTEVSSRFVAMIRSQLRRKV